MMDRYKTPKTLFVLAQANTFGMITLLQFVSGWVFVLTLLAMHGGIALFIVSKKHFLRLGRPIKRHYHLAYAFLALYLPVLGYKLLSRLVGFSQDEELVFVYVMAVTVLAVLAGVLNTIILFRSLAKLPHEES